MFLANIFYYSKLIFQLKKRDTRLFHFLIFVYETYYIYFKINSSLNFFKFCHSANKLIIHFKFLKYLSLLVRKRQILFILHFISLSIFLTILSVFLIDCSISSSLLLMSESRSFSNTWSLLNFVFFLVLSYKHILYYKRSSFQLGFCQFYLVYSSQLRYTLTKILSVLTFYKLYTSKQNYFNAKKD